MTPEHGADGPLRAALARSADSHAPSPAPVGRILAAGRARRRRRRAAVVTAAASVLATGLLLSVPGRDRAADPVRPGPPATAPAPSPSRPAGVSSALVAHGGLGGTAWSVTLEYHPALPSGFDEAVSASGLLCQRMVIGGVRIDHQGGPWSDCEPVTGPQDPAGSGEEGLWGLHDKGTSGFRLFVANPSADIARGVVTLADGTRLEARTVRIPRTTYRAWAVAIPSGGTIASVDQYDGHGHRVAHETQWR